MKEKATHFISILRYIIRYQWQYIALFLLIVICITFIVDATNNKTVIESSQLDRWFTNLLDPIIGVATALITLGIWFFESRIDWRDNLPKRLSVLFLYQSKPCFYAHKAILFDESDARALALSIGAQMANTNFIPYSPFIKFDSAIEDDTDGRKIKHYKVAFTITNKIKPMGAPSTIAPDTEKVKIWRTSGHAMENELAGLQISPNSKDECARSIFELMHK